MWDGKLTDGSAFLLQAGKSDVGRGCCLQVVTTKNIQQPSGVRLRVVLSDGKHKISAVLASQVCAKVSHVNLEGAIVRINEFQLNGLAQPGGPQKILLVTSLDVLADRRPIIGNPVEINTGTPSPALAPAPQQAKPAAAFGAKPAAQPPQRQYPPAAAASPYVPAAAAPVSYAAAPGVVNDAGDGGPAPTSFGSAIDHSRVTPISSLNPYSTANWTIKARVSNKSQIRTYAGKNGQGGRLFSVELVDQDGEIRATGFGNTVDSLYPVLQQGKVYYISRGDVKQANKKFTGSINNNYEVTFNHNTSVELAVDDTDALPTQHYRFTRISDLPDVGVGNTTDILGVVREATEITTRNTKVGESSHRVLIVGDSSKATVNVTLWGRAAEATQGWAPGNIVAMKGLKIGDYGGISMSAGGTSVLEVSPAVPEAATLHAWLESPEGMNCAWHALTSGRGPRQNAGDGQGANANVQHQPAKWMTFAEANKIADAASLAPFWAYATVQLIKHDQQSNWTYPACPKCNKKMMEQNNEWDCLNEKCKFHGSPVRRYTMQVALLDHTGQIYTTAFQETGERLLNATAQDMYALLAAGRTTELDHQFQNALMRTWKVKIAPKFETYQDRQRLKMNLVELEAVNYGEAAKFLLDRLSVLESS